MQIPTKRLDPNAILPTRAYPTDAGADLYALEGGYLRPGQRALVRTGIAMAVPPGYYARIAPRSGLAVKNGIDVLAGVVDSAFRKEIQVVLINLSDGGDENVYQWQAGDRIAQLIIEQCAPATFVEDELDETQRGAGFGSSGS